MAIKFFKLMDLLNRKGINKGDLIEMTGISSATMAKLSANKHVSLDVINKICEVLECQPCDVMEFIPDPSEK